MAFTLLLTGTPVQNNLKEVMNCMLLHACLSGLISVLFDVCLPANVCNLFHSVELTTVHVPAAHTASLQLYSLLSFVAPRVFQIAKLDTFVEKFSDIRGRPPVLYTIHLASS